MWDTLLLSGVVFHFFIGRFKSNLRAEAGILNSIDQSSVR